MSSILITGGLGFIGSACARELASDSKNNIFIIDNFSRVGAERRFLELSKFNNIKIVKSNIINIDKVFDESKEISEKNLKSIYDIQIVNKKYETEFINIIKYSNYNNSMCIFENDIFDGWHNLIYVSNYLKDIKGKYYKILSSYEYKIKELATNILLKLHSEFNEYIHDKVKNIIVFINHQKTLLLNTHISDLKSNFDIIIEKINNEFQSVIMGLEKVFYLKR
jgi:hypothetical protein